MLVTALCGAAYGVLAQRAFARYAALTVTAYAMVLGTFVLLPAAVAEGLVAVPPQLDRQTVALLVFWTFALTQLTPTQVAVYINLNPLVAILLAAVLLAERLTIVFAMGFGVVLVGVLLVKLAEADKGVALEPWSLRKSRPYGRGMAERFRDLVYRSAWKDRSPDFGRRGL
jgi:drug/metabolite transporter (DMT)-like permease